MKEAFVEYLMPPLLTALGGLAVAAIGLLTQWLAAKAGNERVGGLIARVGEAVRVAVLHVEQTMRPQIEAALSDGSISEEEARKLRAAALAAAKAELGPVLGQLAGVFGLVGAEAVDAFLVRRIEATVASMPATHPSPP